MAQQTAVEWLVQELTVVYPRIEEMKLLTDKARHTEKEQQKYFFECGRNFQLTGENTFEQCYNETYGKE